MATIREIKTGNIQMSVAGVGKTANDLDDIRQCIAVILTTPTGSDALRPFFGSDIFKFADTPVNIARPGISREALKQINKFETRVKVTKIDVILNNADREKRQVLINITAVLLYNSAQIELLYNIDSLFKRTPSEIDPNSWALDQVTGYAAEDIYYLKYQ